MKSYRIAPSLVFWFSDFIIHRKGGYAILLCFKSCKVLYILVGDYYIPDLKLPEEHRPIGKYGRMHREYLREVHPARLNTLILTGELWTYLADLNEQAQERLDTIME